MDALRAGIFRIEEKLSMLGQKNILQLPTAISKRMPCETIDEMIALNSMDKEMLNILVCILNYEITIVVYHFTRNLLTSYISYTFYSNSN